MRQQCVSFQDIPGGRLIVKNSCYSGECLSIESFSDGEAPKNTSAARGERGLTRGHEKRRTLGNHPGIVRLESIATPCLP